MNNNNCKKVLAAVGMIDNIVIVLKHKPEGIYKRETFFIRKKVYVLDL